MKTLCRTLEEVSTNKKNIHTSIIVELLIITVIVAMSMLLMFVR